MDQVHVIRYKVLQEGKSIRSVAREMRVSRNTVRKYLRQSEPVRKQEHPRSRPVLESVAARIDQLREEWSDQTTPKQRVTGSRLHRQLVEEGHRVGITTVRDYLRERRRQAAEVYVPLVWRPGEAAQVDFFEVTVEVVGVRQKVWKFLLRLMYSQRDFVWLYPRADQLAFLDGHVRAFEHFQGVVARLVYDNLSAAVKRKVGLERPLTERFQALSSHYLFEPCFARPGEGHDKGGVEARGKGVRLQHLTPVPCGESLGQLSRQLLADLDRASTQQRDGAGRSVAERFAEERSRLRPLPEVPFEARQLRLVTVNRRALVRIEGADYSVPSHWKLLEVEARVGVEDIVLSSRGETQTVARVGRGGRQVQYRHYLSELARKPQAVRQVAPELVAELGPPYGRLWELLSQAHGERKGARVLAGLLAALVRLGEPLVLEAVESALQAGRCDLRTLQQRLYPRQVREVAVPEALRDVPVEAARARDFDHLLEGERR